MSVWVEQLAATDARTVRTVFWASGGRFDRFETALADDPTVTDSSVVAESDDYRLYCIRLPGGLRDVRAYVASVELDAVLLGAKGDADGWTVRMLFPDNEAFTTFRDRCAEHGLSVAIRTVYSQHPAPHGRLPALTDRQHETLLRAVESGYFAIPRETSLEDLADTLGVSPQATSERLRRGIRTLVRGVLGDATDDRPPWSDDPRPPDIH